MGAISEMLLSLLLCAAVLIVIRAVKITVSVPVRTGKETEMLVVLNVHGEDNDLEHTVRGITAVCDGAKIILVDCGMTEETRRRAEILSHGGRGIALKTKREHGAEYERK